MKKAVAVVDALKRALRARGVTYADVAKALRLSEASVKRLFSSGHFTLDRFEQVCEVARTSLSELAKSIDDGSEDITQLTLEQEREIMADHKLLLVALCALNHLTLEQMTQTYEVSKAKCIRLLVALDRIKFLELLPNNRIKLRVTRAFLVACERADSAVLQGACSERILRLPFRPAGGAHGLGQQRAIQSINRTGDCEVAKGGQRGLRPASRGCTPSLG